MKEKKIVFLWAEIAGYLISVLEELIAHYDANVSVVYWDYRTVNSTRFKVATPNPIELYKRSTTDDKSILELLNRVKPEVIVISGWMDKGYIKASRKFKSRNPRTKVVACIDDQWTGSLRQKVGKYYYRFAYKSLFDYMWVAGKPQFSFAQHFGYQPGKILSNLLSADTKLFKKAEHLNKRFVFVGRFDPVKALDLLVDAYGELSIEVQKQWPLYLIGDGEHKDMIVQKKNPNIRIIPFLQPVALREELAKGGIGCLTSHKDQWGVVIHEFALMGFPLLLSSGCGASTEFLIPGFNGFMFENGSKASLLAAMNRFLNLSDDELMLFSSRSALLGQKINTEQAAASLISIYYNNL